MSKKQKDQRPAVEIAMETAGTMREAAVRAEHVARRLLRRTRLLTSHASRKLPVVPTIEPPATDNHITLVLPELPTPLEDERAAHAREVLELRARTEQAEHAASWLRARLRSQRARAASRPQIDAAALTSDLTRGLAAVNTANREAVRRVVQQALAAHGLAANTRRDSSTAHDPAAMPWAQEQQDALARAVLARAPDVADPAYIHRAVGLVAQRGRQTLPELTRAAGYESAMARRRLRLTVEALVALGPLTVRDGAYSLNAQWAPPKPPADTRGRRGGKSNPRR